jgi:hypothetical protein
MTPALHEWQGPRRDDEINILCDEFAGQRGRSLVAALSPTGSGCCALLPYRSPSCSAGTVQQGLMGLAVFVLLFAFGMADFMIRG